MSSPGGLALSRGDRDGRTGGHCWSMSSSWSSVVMLSSRLFFEGLKIAKGWTVEEIFAKRAVWVVFGGGAVGGRQNYPKP